MTRWPLRMLAAAMSLAAVGGAPALAGSSVRDVEAWLDRAPPTDVAPGSTFAFGALLWDRRNTTIVDTSVLVRVHPASGDAAPQEFPVRRDWPGHYIARLTAPAGGLGQIELATAGTACTADGCTRSDLIYAVAGTGPPPDAPLTTIATAEVVVPAERIVAGAPADVTVELTPRAAWDPDRVPWPDMLVLQVRRPREPVLLDAEASRVAGATGTYRAAVSVPEAGTFVFQVAEPGADGTDGSIFGGSTVSLSVEAADAPGAREAEGDQVPIAAIIGLAGLVVIGVATLVLVARRADT